MSWQAQLDRMERKQDDILRLCGYLPLIYHKEFQIVSELSDAMDAAEAAAAKEDTVEASVEALLTGLSGQITDLAAKLATAGVDPALVARAKALGDHIAANNDKFTAAIVANTSAAPPSTTP